MIRVEHLEKKFGELTAGVRDSNVSAVTEEEGGHSSRLREYWPPVTHKRHVATSKFTRHLLEWRSLKEDVCRRDTVIVNPARQIVR